MATIIILAGLLLAAAFAVSIAMAIRSAANRPWRFELSRVIGDAFSAIVRAPWFFVATAIVASAAPVVLLLLTGWQPGSRGMFGFYGASGLPAFAWFAIGQFANILLVVATLDVLEHGRVDAVSALSRALRLLPAAMAVTVLFWIAVVIGFVFFFAPGVFLMCLWFVATPALAAERTGIFGCFGRSAVLTAGVRWQLLLLVVVGGIFWLVMQGMIAVIASIFDGGVGAAIIHPLLSSLLAVLPPAVAASAYHSLRTQKEGLRGDALEEVFA